MMAEPRIIKHHLREVQDICGYSIVGQGQTLGALTGLVFDPQSWDVLHFLITESGTQGKPVGVPVQLFRSLDDVNRTLEVGLTREGLRSAEHYTPDVLARKGLVGTTAVVGKIVDCSDGPAGRIGDLLVNVDVWQLRYLVIEAGSTRVLTDIEWCSSFDDCQAHPVVDLPAEAIITAPPYEALEELCSGFEEALYRHYTSRAYVIESDVA